MFHIFFTILPLKKKKCVRRVCFAKNRLHFAKNQKLTVCDGCVLDANHHNGFKQTDFLRFVPPIFLTLTSQGDNQGIANAMDKKQIRLREIPFFALKA